MCILRRLFRFITKTGIARVEFGSGMEEVRERGSDYVMGKLLN